MNRAADRVLAELQQAERAAANALTRAEVEEIVARVLGAMQPAGDSAAVLYGELAALARFIQHARAEIAAIRPDSISSEHIPTATDELDAVVGATEDATHRIMDTCDAIMAMTSDLPEDKAAALNDAVTRIYEACNFQDITGQRITKVVRTLRQIEQQVQALLQAFGGDAANLTPPRPSPVAAQPPSDAALLNGPQLPGNAISQDDIDRLLSS